MRGRGGDFSFLYYVTVMGDAEIVLQAFALLDGCNNEDVRKKVRMALISFLSALFYSFLPLELRFGHETWKLFLGYCLRMDMWMKATNQREQCKTW